MEEIERELQLSLLKTSSNPETLANCAGWALPNDQVLSRVIEAAWADRPRAVPDRRGVSWP